MRVRSSTSPHALILARTDPGAKGKESNARAQRTNTPRALFCMVVAVLSQSAHHHHHHVTGIIKSLLWRAYLMAVEWQCQWISSGLDLLLVFSLLVRSVLRFELWCDAHTRSRPMFQWTPSPPYFAGLADRLSPPPPQPQPPPPPLPLPPCVCSTLKDLDRCRGNCYSVAARPLAPKPSRAASCHYGSTADVI